MQYFYVLLKNFLKEELPGLWKSVPKKIDGYRKNIIFVLQKNTILVNWQLLIKSSVSYRSIGPKLIKFIGNFIEDFLLSLVFLTFLWNFYGFIKFEVTSTVNMKATFFESVTPCSLASLWKDYVQHTYSGITRLLLNFGRCRL